MTEGAAVRRQTDDGLLDYALLGWRPRQTPDMVRLRGHDWCPSVYRNPGEGEDAFWGRVIKVAMDMRVETLQFHPQPEGTPFRLVMWCEYGVGYVDPDTALRGDLLDATRWRLKRLMENPASSPEVQVQAASLLATLLLAT